MASIQYRSATVFAPTNQAFQRNPDIKANVLYHISKCYFPQQSSIN
jgi:uncharacterized surface protein with fasciclin (FAS1) repeats